MDSRKTSQEQSQSSPKTGSPGTASKNGQSGFRFDDNSTQDAGMATTNFAVEQSSISLGTPEGPLGNEGRRNSQVLWLRRLTLALFVVVCVEVGIVLVVLPWTHVWTDNTLLIGNSTLRLLAMHNFVRGLVSGLGFINVWMGIWEAVHYREPKKASN